MRLLALVALALAACGEASTADEPPEIDDRFVPPTHRDGDRTVMPLTFPDGTRAAITYPPELAIAELGLEPYGSATLQGDSPHPARSDEVGRDFAIRYGAAPRPRPRSLLLRFGRWAVEVYDYAARSPAVMTRAERRDFRRSLTGRTTAAGSSCSKPSRRCGSPRPVSTPARRSTSACRTGRRGSC